MPRLQPLLAPIAIALLLPSSATAQSLSALVSVNSSSLSIASLHQENGTVSRILPPFSTSGGGLSGECNAGFDGLRYYKNTADGYLHTVYAPTGHVMGKVALRNHPGNSSCCRTLGDTIRARVPSGTTARVSFGRMSLIRYRSRALGAANRR